MIRRPPRSTPFPYPTLFRSRPPRAAPLRPGRHRLRAPPYVRARLMGRAIGIPAAIERVRWGPWEADSDMMPRSYAAAVQRAGGLVLLLSPDPEAGSDPDQWLDLLDGIILAGGADIDPALYGEERHPQTGPCWPERDTFEIALARRAIERDLPVLRICRGMQLLNVALGGTLDQHLPDS